MFAWRNFQKNLVAYLHMINETLSHKFYPYSILIGSNGSCIRCEMDLWAVWAEQHAPYTQLLPRPAKKESNVPKLKSS